MSEAIASTDGQSPMMSSNETILGARSFMALVLGQYVLKSKATLSCDYKKSFKQYRGMPDRMSETEEKLAFIRRTRQAREARWPTQKAIYTLLDLTQGTYKQYETRTPLPHRYIPKFCLATGVSMEWLLTGEGQGPVVQEYPREVSKRVRRVRRNRAA